MMSVQGEAKVTETTTTTTSNQTEDAGPVIFVPGFKGSRLVDAETGEVRWLTAWGALALAGPPALALPGAHALAPAGALESLLGGMYPVYAPFLRAARSRWGARLHVFAYDWRQSCVATARELETFLLRLLQNAASAAPPTLIVHSMGGLVTWALLSRLANLQEEDEQEQRAQLLEWMSRARVVFVGTPFQPIEALLEDMTPGTPAHCRYLPAAVLATHPAAYELLAPPRSACDARLHDTEHWAQRGVGAFACADVPRARAAELVRAGLAGADAFRTHTLRADFAGTPLAHVRAAVVAGRTRPTKTGLPAAFFDCAAPLDWRAVPRTPGDGRVPLASAVALPAGLDFRTVVLTPNDHGALLNDFKALLLAISSLDSSVEDS